MRLGIQTRTLFKITGFQEMLAKNVTNLKS